MPFHIAIDGPVAAGKGTVARLVAARLGFLYVDTGAMYRATALLAMRGKLDATDQASVVRVLEGAQIDLRAPSEMQKDGRSCTVLLNDEDVSWAIRTEAVSGLVGIVAQHPEVRALLVARQQEIAAQQDVVMEGRDITYRVLPNAQLKIYLDARDVVRAKRRHFELQSRGEDISFTQVYESLLERDRLDTTRKTDPLQVVDEAWVIDTSELSINQAVDIIVTKVRVVHNLDTQS